MLLVKKVLQFRCVHVLHLGLLHGLTSGGRFLSLGSAPDSVCVGLLREVPSCIRISKDCSTVGLTSARMSIFRSVGYANVANLGLPTSYYVVEELLFSDDQTEVVVDI